MDSQARRNLNAKASPIQPGPFPGPVIIPTSLRYPRKTICRVVFVFLELAQPKKISVSFPKAAPLHDDTRVAGNTGPELSSLLADGASDGRALHLTLGVDDLESGWSVPFSAAGAVSSLGLFQALLQAEDVARYPSPNSSCPPSRSMQG